MLNLLSKIFDFRSWTFWFFKVFLSFHFFSESSCFGAKHTKESKDFLVHFFQKNLRSARGTPFSTSAPHFSVKLSLTKRPREPNSKNFPTGSPRLSKTRYFPTGSPRLLKQTNSDWFAPFRFMKPKGLNQSEFRLVRPPSELTPNFRGFICCFWQEKRVEKPFKSISDP